MISDSLHELNVKDKKFVEAIAYLMNGVNFLYPTELSTLVTEHSGDNYSNKIITKVVRRLLKNLEKLDIYCNIRKSNGYRILDFSKESGESSDNFRLLK